MEPSTLPETQDAVQTLSRILWTASVLIVLLAVAALGMYAWYFLYSPCELNAVEDASALLLSQMKRYDKEYQFAATAPRDGIIHPLVVLQQIHRDTRDVLVPGCLQTAKEELVNYMGAVNRAFQAFGAQEAEATVRELINQSEMHYDNFNTEMEAVRQCAPFCRR